MRRILARDLAVSLLFLILAILMTWPLVRNLSCAISDPADPFFTTWTLDWDFYATVHHARLFDANIFFPNHLALAFSEHLYGIALVLFPLFAAGVAPLTIHNVGVLLGFAGCGYAQYALTRWITGSTAGGIVGGIAFAFVGIRFHHLPHLPYIWAMWLPAALLALLWFAEGPSWMRALALTGVLVMNGLTTLHWFVFAMVAITITGIVIGWAQLHGRRYLLLFIISLAATLIALAPFLLPYEQVRRLYGMQRYYAEALPNGAAEASDWLKPNYQNKLYGWLSPRQEYGHERTLFPGVVVCLLVGIGLLFARRDMLPERLFIEPPLRQVGRSMRRALEVGITLSALATALGVMAGNVNVGWHGGTLVAYTGMATPATALLLLIFLRIALFVPGVREWLRASRFTLPVWSLLLWVVIGAWGAKGLHGIFDTVLFDHLDAFRSIRVPARWAMISYVGLSGIAGVATTVLVRERARWSQLLITVGLCATMLFDLRVAPLRWFLVSNVEHPVYTWLATVQLHGGVLELPMDQGSAYEYLWRATMHHQRLINGVSSYIPPRYEELLAQYNTSPISSAFMSRLIELPCSLVIVHANRLRERSADVRGALRQAIAAGQLVFLRRFDAGGGADYVFASPPVEPQSLRWAAPAVPDPAGRTPVQNAQLFLERDGYTYSHQPFGSIDVVPPDVTRGALTISGWALAPAGVRRVNLRFNNGAVRIPTDLGGERPDVVTALPWYPASPRPGFSHHFDGPPSGVRGNTDLQVEIIDNLGHSILTVPFWFQWRKRPLPRLAWNEPELRSLLDRLHAPARAYAAIIDGTGCICDYTSSLVTDTEEESDARFAARLTSTLLGAGGAPVVSPWERLLANDTSRERTIDAILRSQEFAAKYIRAGQLIIDKPIASEALIN